MDKYYRNSWMNVVENVGSNLSKGLLEYDCILRREEFGDNSISLPLKGVIKNKFKYTINFITILINIVLFSLFLSSKKYEWALIFAAVIIIELVYKVFYILKQVKFIKIINTLNKVNVTVIREGVERIVESHELVIGDIVKLKKGSIISADMRIIKSNKLLVDEQKLTGNSISVEKYENVIEEVVSSINQITNMVFRGSTVIDGEGIAVVVKCGFDTYLGQILQSVNNINKKDTLILKVNSVVNKIKVILLIINIILFMIIPGSGQAKNNMFINNLFSISIISIPLISIIYSKIIKDKLKNEDIHINYLSTAVDASNVNVVFLKELGSITKDEFVVRSIYCDETYKDVKEINISDINIKRILDILFINSSEYFNNGKKRNDLIDNAYIDFINKISLNKLKVRRENKIKFKNEIELDKKFVTTVVKNERGYRANVRGNLEDVLTRATYILVNGIEKPLTQDEIDKIKHADLYFSSKGFVTEAIAYRSFNYEPTAGENIESNLVFVGLVALENLLNLDTIDNIANLYENGILPIIFSENNKIVAEVIGRKAGIVDSSKEVVSGVELSFLDEKEFLKCISKARILCRLTSEQKNKIVSLFNKDKFNVAIESENLSDLPSLQESLVGMTKTDSSNLLKEINGNVIKYNGLSSILKLRKIGVEIEKFISKASLIYIQFLLGQIFASYNYYFVDDGVLFSTSSLVLLNMVLVCPLILVQVDKKDELSRYQKVLMISSYIIIAMMAIPLVKRFSEFVVFTVLVINIFITVLCNSKFKISFRDRNFIILLIQMVLSILSIYLVFILTEVVLNKALIIVISMMIIMYAIMVLITKKWQS